MENVVVRHMLDLIDSHYADVVTLRTLSSRIGRQPAYLGRLFRQEVGASLHEYLTEIRMRHAAELIRQGVKIEAVALCVGYRSKKNFYQQFKKQFATTPIPYRCRTEGRVPDQSNGLFNVDAQQPTLASPVADADSPGIWSIVRASQRAWRLAVRSQHRLLQRSGRLEVAILLTGRSGQYIGANRAAVDMTGYSRTELHGLAPADLFVRGPGIDPHSVWQILLPRPRASRQGPGATVRTKAGDPLDVCVVTLRNLLSERHGCALLNEVRGAHRRGVGFRQRPGESAAG